MTPKNIQQQTSQKHTPQFQPSANQIEEQQKLLISGFEGIELNNQQQT